MMITSTDHHRTVRRLGSTESRPWCARVPITSRVSAPTFPITSPVSASYTDRLHRRALLGGGPARFTTLSSTPHVIQSP